MYDWCMCRPDRESGGEACGPVLEAEVYPPTLVKEDEALPVTEESATQEYGRQGGREY